MKKVLMIGLYGVYNYGCEAIVRGSVEILKHKYNGNVKIFLATPSLIDDKRRLSDCDVEFVERKFNKYCPLNIVRKLSNKIGYNFPVIIEDIEDIEQYDAIYSVGGDIYTLDHEGFAPLNFIAFANKCIDKGIPYYMLCSSIGPFNDNYELKTIIPHLKKIDKIYAREQETIRYLFSLGVEDNVQFLSDPAFQVKKGLIKDNNLDKKIKIGINLSPLSTIHFYKNIESGIEKQVNAIERLLNLDEDIEVFLIPHVKSSVENDDDFAYLKLIYERINSLLKKRVTYISEDNGFIGRKQILVKMDYVIAARMHCAINAICCHVPTLFLSYSKKAIGMSELIYETDKGVLSLPDLEDERKVMLMLKALPDFKLKLAKLQDLDNYL